MKEKIVAIGICMLMIIIVGLPATGNTNKISSSNDKVMMEFVPGEFIVKLKQDTTFSRSTITTLNEQFYVSAIDKVFSNAESTILDNIYLLHVPIGSDILSIVHAYSSCPDVVYAEPNEICHPCGIPNDANFSRQWYMQNTGQIIFGNISGTPDADIDALEAWDIQKGNPMVMVAILDSGIDYTHPDLATNIWNNTDEISGNGIDDDHNGYIDDVRGWDFYYNDSNVTDGHGHGTMCAGIADAVTNNDIGIAGVCWNCTIIPVRIANALWNSNTVMSAKGIRYAADNGADVISMSWGFYSNPSVLRDAVNYAYNKGVFMCAAVGNDNITTKFYPAAYENVTAVAATNQNDKRCMKEDWDPYNIWPGELAGSNYGDWVDIAAPACLIYSTMPTYHCHWNERTNWYTLENFSRDYDWTLGTSSASPIVAGVAALLLSKNPSLTPIQVKNLLCENVDPYNSTEYIGTGRINAQKAIAALQWSLEVAIKGGIGVKVIITNNGTSSVNDIPYQIHVEGGILGMINKTVNGTIDIPAGDTVTVGTGMLLGFGAISITTKVADEEQATTGTQLIIFSMVKK
jgi:subtilisin family serine protease